MPRKYSPAQLEFMSTLKASSDVRAFINFPLVDGQLCRMKIVGRGEVAFYQRGDRALLFEINAGHGLISRKSLKWWDTDQAISSAELEIVLSHAVAALKQLGFPEVSIV